MSVVKEFEYLKVPFTDIKEGTKSFTTIIGEGGFGPVYTGNVSISGKLTSVAVKRLSGLFGQGLKEFLTEIHLLSRYKHPNLVSLLGYCEQDQEKILIYEYADHGSFDKLLHPAKARCPLSWWRRVNICTDAARGLNYLHNHVGEHHRVIHRDIKCANILVGHNWKGMIADLGLSKIGRANENVTYLITNAGGTLGYCDPAYIDTGILTKESDVYSFGVVLFETLCGRLFFMDVARHQRLHVPLARYCYEQGKLNDIVDLDLKGAESMKEFSKIAYQCLNPDPKERPSMELVLLKLEKALKLIELEDTSELQVIQESVEALVLQEIVEAMELQELSEALKSHKLGEILELQTNDALLQAIHMKTNTHPAYATKEETYTDLFSGILIDNDKVLFSIDKNGNNHEMISAMKFMHPYRNKCEAITSPQSQFPMVAKLLHASTVNMQVTIRTQFLSPKVTYSAYLVCKHIHTSKKPQIVNLEYKLNNQRRSSTSYPEAYKDGWVMMELFQTHSYKGDNEFKVLIENFALDTDPDEVIVEGIMFMPTEKLDDEIQDIIEVEDPPTTEIEWENRLPTDYKKILKPSWNCFNPKTEEEAYNTLLKGVYVNVNDNLFAWLWLTNSNGKKCFIISPESFGVDTTIYKLRDTIYDLESRCYESRFKYKLEVSSDDISIAFKIRNPLLSMKTAYACYLVYKTSNHVGHPLMVKIKQWMLNLPSGERDMRNNHYNQERLVYLSTPQRPVIGPDGEEKPPNTNYRKPELIETPRKRKDCWWEVRVGEFITPNTQLIIEDSRPCCIPCFPYVSDAHEEEADEDEEEADNATTIFARLCPEYDPTIRVEMSWPTRKLSLSEVLNLEVKGIEFRPIEE